VVAGESQGRVLESGGMVDLLPKESRDNAMRIC
jgi:hypothetical protein